SDNASGTVQWILAERKVCDCWSS
nr:hypothetical protein [Tanacetum cinerariifolium]